MTRFTRLSDWLDWQTTLHPDRIDLGLERVAEVAGRMGLLKPAYRVVSVAGTNGKGSSVAMLDAIYRAAGYCTASYTSPHLLRYNERIRIDGVEVTDEELCAAFTSVDAARGDISLTYFEFGTLAALQLFDRARLDIAILEVGMGGRLDAVNIVDADVALVTCIDIDHRTWLGSDRDSIGREKAGIFRSGHPAICSDPSPPDSVRQAAVELAATWCARGDGFDYRATSDNWSWSGRSMALESLPLPALPGRHQLDNAAGVLAVVEALQDACPVERAAIEQGLSRVRLGGRCQIIPGDIELLVDVAHNPAAAATLAGVLRTRPSAACTWLVLGMLDDKDTAGFAEALEDCVDVWCLAGLSVERGLSAARLQQRTGGVTDGRETLLFDTVTAAMRDLQQLANPGDRIVVCGSFFGVAEALECQV
jgi:dihydrofolate synthase/folylpolyglutamate synthase